MSSSRSSHASLPVVRSQSNTPTPAALTARSRSRRSISNRALVTWPSSGGGLGGLAEAAGPGPGFGPPDLVGELSQVPAPVGDQVGGSRQGQQVPALAAVLVGLVQQRLERPDGVGGGRRHAERQVQGRPPRPDGLVEEVLLLSSERAVRALQGGDQGQQPPGDPRPGAGVLVALRDQRELALQLLAV